MSQAAEMWQWHGEALCDVEGLRFTIESAAGTGSYAQILEWLAHDGGFRESLNALLARAPYASFRWETPPVDAATAGRDFEFVLLDSPELLRQADPRPFASQFRASPEAEVLEFDNLGGDALLIVPAPVGDPQMYAHLASFVRGASTEQRDELWRRVGVAMGQRLASRRVWLSTAGAGVAWLHVRLDDRPKYYCFDPYRKP